ncbi:cysteine--tRNA ligase [Candidatus Pacearchaeota archaeon]|nr:MAG: cysteine--tRNA ligase [Candidatus Pacearchaeota archaeon]
MKKLQLYNTLTRRKEPFKPIHDNEARVYTCGPTVYSYQHIGNMRAYIFADTLKRVLLFNGYKVKHVINVTDVGHLTSDADEGEDKIERAARKEKKSAKEIAEFYFSVFKQDLRKLNVLEPDVWPKASEHIKEQIELIKKLESKGYTYTTSDGIYFDSSKFKDYGKLARLKPENLKAGKRVALREKKHKTDFALWKFSEKPGVRQQEWDPKNFGADWPTGFPGWHIECSAMSMKYLGESFDIHTGGEDHIAVHHTNEIAQSEAATGKKFVNYWLHVAFLTFKGKKVSKSTGGLYTISELEEMGYSPLAFRYLCLQTHYRKPLAFSFQNLDSAQHALERARRKVIEEKNSPRDGKDKTQTYLESFANAINDDLNTPLALQVLWQVLDDESFASDTKLALIEKFDLALGLNLSSAEEEKVRAPEEVKQLLEKREELRQKKKFEEADKLREEIKARGFAIEDTPSGPKLRRLKK